MYENGNHTPDQHEMLLKWKFLLGSRDTIEERLPFQVPQKSLVWCRTKGKTSNVCHCATRDATLHLPHVYLNLALHFVVDWIESRASLKIPKLCMFRKKYFGLASFRLSNFQKNNKKKTKWEKRKRNVMTSVQRHGENCINKLSPHQLITSSKQVPFLAGGGIPFRHLNSAKLSPSKKNFQNANYCNGNLVASPRPREKHEPSSSSIMNEGLMRWKWRKRYRLLRMFSRGVALRR